MTEKELRYVREPDFIFRKVVEEMILVPIHQNMGDMDCIYTLNEVGAFIWEILALPKTREELQTAVMNDFDADPGEVLADLDQFLQELIEFGAVGRS